MPWGEETRGPRGWVQGSCQNLQSADIRGGGNRHAHDRRPEGPDYSLERRRLEQFLPALRPCKRSGFTAGLRWRNAPFPNMAGRLTQDRNGTLHSEIGTRHTAGVRQPWNALTTLVAHPDAPLGRAESAWEEVAARLGLTRLGWRRCMDPNDPQEFAFAYPSLHAVTRWRALRAHPVGRGPGSADEDLARVTEDGGELIASAPRGQLPGPGTLRELCTLASALDTRRVERRRLALAERRADQARRTVAAGHDLRNELTRALLFQSRGTSEDQLEVTRALAAARELAQDALIPDGTTPSRPLESLRLRETLAEECRAATHAARVPGGALPKLRLRCPKALAVLVRPDSFRRAVRNLATNSLEAASWNRTHRGAVSVFVEALPADHEWRVHGFSAVLVIEDDGIGMDSREVQQFLSPKGRGAPRDTVQTKPGSTGLGTASLSLALEASGLPIRVTSAPRRGTRVELFLRKALESSASVIVDRDVRRGPREVRRLGGPETAWWVASPAAGHMLDANAGLP